jgi:branched-chain amino acid transport system substrate-binding protein
MDPVDFIVIGAGMAGASAAYELAGLGSVVLLEQNRAVARRLKETIFRSVAGAVHYHARWQAAIPYPDATQDPSLGMPHLFFQIQDHEREQVLIAPEPYHTGRFKLPPWMSRA